MPAIWSQFSNGVWWPSVCVNERFLNKELPWCCWRVILGSSFWEAECTPSAPPVHPQAPSSPSLKEHVLQSYMNCLSFSSPLPAPGKQCDHPECHLEKWSLADYLRPMSRSARCTDQHRSAGDWSMTWELSYGFALHGVFVTWMDTFSDQPGPQSWILTLHVILTSVDWNSLQSTNPFYFSFKGRWVGERGTPLCKSYSTLELHHL